MSTLYKCADIIRVSIKSSQLSLATNRSRLPFKCFTDTLNTYVHVSRHLTSLSFADEFAVIYNVLRRDNQTYILLYFWCLLCYTKYG